MALSTLCLEIFLVVYQSSSLTVSSFNITAGGNYAKVLSLYSKTSPSPVSNNMFFLPSESSPAVSLKSRFLLQFAQWDLNFLMHAFQNSSSHRLISGFTTTLTFLCICYSTIPLLGTKICVYLLLHNKLAQT